MSDFMPSQEQISAAFEFAGLPVPAERLAENHTTYAETLALIRKASTPGLGRPSRHWVSRRTGTDGTRICRAERNIRMELYELPLIEVAEKIRTKEVSPVEVAESSLARLEEVEPLLTAFVTTTPELALEQAKAAEKEIADGKYRGPLHGIPLGVKDLYDTAGIRTTSSSAQRADYVPDADSVSVAKLYDAGMVLVGKTHTHEFAYGATTPTTGNPWAPDRTPGGSSGGSGAAVAAGVVHVALGSDTGGSIRIPAALCGTVGLKPTYGRASRVGVASLSWSLDHVGPLSRNVTDAALVMQAMSGYDRRDPGTANVAVPDMVSGIDAGVAGKRSASRSTTTPTGSPPRPPRPRRWPRPRSRNSAPNLSRSRSRWPSTSCRPNGRS